MLFVWCVAKEEEGRIRGVMAVCFFVCVCICVKERRTPRSARRFFKLQEENEAVGRLFYFLLPLTCFSSCSLNYLVCPASSPVCFASTWKGRGKRRTWEDGGFKRNRWRRGLLLSSSESL